MSKTAELRQKRGELWDKAKAFLNEHADENGMMNAEDTATYERMEQDIDNFGAAIDREERAERLERELNTPTSKVLSSRPEKPLTDDEICERLNREGCRLSRRTVSKYRQAAGIPGNVKRRQKRS